MTQPDSADRLRKQRAVLADFGLRAFCACDLDELLREAVGLVSSALGIRMVKILEWRPEKNDFLLRAGVGWKPGVVGHATIGAGEESPAGYALRCDGPVVSPDVDRETRFRIPQLLRDHGVQSMVNVIIAGGGESFGVLEVDAPEQRDFDEDDIAFLRTYANLLAAAVDRLRSHQALQETARERAILVRELQHRVKNMLTIVQSFARLTSAEKRTAEEFREALLGRLDALARAHALLSESSSAEVDLRHLVNRLVEPHAVDRPEAVTVEGEAVGLSPKLGLGLGLVLHELATNAVKHGALSAPDGRVQVAWRVESTNGGQHVRLLWQESGGPSAEPPGRRGFGTTLIERTCAYDLDGEARIVHAGGGLRCEIVFPKK